MAKAAEAFRTISEVADELDLHKHVLRFWEVKFPQIKPMKRGGGRRYYRPGDVELLRGIRHLLHAEGYTIRGVQRILRERGIDTVKKVGAEVAETGVAASMRELGPPPSDLQEIAVTIGAPEPSVEKAVSRSPARTVSAKVPPIGAKGGREQQTTARGIAAAILELESCRALLVGRDGDGKTSARDAERPKRSARAAS